MKHMIIFSMALLLAACGPTQRITNSWINPEATSHGPYKKFFVMVLSPTKETSFSVEDRLAGVIASRGQDFVLSSAVFPPNLKVSEDFTREEMAEAIKRTGCDAVLIVAQLDVKSVETYHQSTVYGATYYDSYSSYYGYYNRYYPMVYSPGYYTVDNTYYIETNFYDLDKDEHLWLIQSEASNPSGVDAWFDTYINQLLDELEKENLLAKP